MKLARWIFFLPIGLCLITIAQLAVGIVAERTSFLVGGPLIIIIGGPLIFLASAIPCWIAPNLKVGAAILLPLFLLFEIVALFSFLRTAPLFPAVARLYADVALVFGGVGAVRSENSKNPLFPDDPVPRR